MRDPKFYCGLLILTWPLWLALALLWRGWLPTIVSLPVGSFIVAWPVFVIGKTREMRRAK